MTVPHYGLPPAPPRRSSPLRAVLLGLMALTVLALIGLVLANMAGSTSDAAYQNDDFQVPPADLSPPALPIPTTYGEAEQWLVDNALYTQNAPIPVRCDAQPINVETADDNQLAAHFNGLMECLVRVWEPPVTGADWEIVRPSVTIYGSEITTRCGKSGVNAFYCSADQQIYFSNQLPEGVPIVRRDKWAADVVMAHEFGHAVQARTGLLVSAHAFSQDTEDEGVANEIIRRLETQSDCFAGMFMNSVSLSLGIQQADVAGIQATFVAVGDDTLTGDPNVEGNHGLARSREYWGSLGLGTTEVGRCNTFVAESRLVR